MKILIIDDEKSARLALKYLLQAMDIEELQILEATNGEDGYAFFCKEEPDIVILDINMPQMNGIDFMEKVEGIIGNTKMIIISGYNEFQFAQKAIQYNVIGYLLKPINRQEFFRVMQRAMEAISQERILSRQLSQVSRNEKIRFLKTLIRGTDIFAEVDKKTLLQEFLEYSSFTVCILRWNLEKIHRKGERVDHQQIHLFVEEFIRTKYRGFCFESSNLENVLVFCGRKDQGSVQPVILLLQKYFMEKYDTVCLAAVGSEVKSIQEISDSYRTAKKKMGQIQLMSDPIHLEVSISPKEYKKNDHQNKNILDSYKNIIQRCFLKNDIMRLEYVLKDILAQIQSGMNWTIGQAELLLRQFIIFADSFYMMNGREETFFLNVSDWQPKICQVCDFQEFEQLFLTIGKTTIERMQETKMDLDWTLDEVKHFIDTNYASELSLDVLAKQYCFSKQYLNTSFKKKYHCNIHEYHLKIRMEKAAELLTDSNLDMKEIANTVGYSDPGYFGRVFKKVFMETPMEYRNNRQKRV